VETTWSSGCSGSFRADIQSAFLHGSCGGAVAIFWSIASETEGFGSVPPYSRYEHAKGVVVRAFNDHVLDFPLARSSLRMVLSMENGWSAILR